MGATPMITSKDNPKIKDLRKLQSRRHRARTERFVAEGEDLIDAALEAGWKPLGLFVTEDAPERFQKLPECEVVDDDLLDSASTLGSGTRAVGVFEERWSEPSGARTSIYLDGLADPGNVGTVLRSAIAFIDGPVILGPGCADPFSPKAVRASMGAVFTRPPAKATFAELEGTKIALDGEAEHQLSEIYPSGPCVICIGAERDGLAPELLAAADETARIEMRTDGPESLNAAMAATIALYEVGGKLQSTVHATADGAAEHGNTVPAEK
jgi:TrmH family RNA methyltransferase